MRNEREAEFGADETKGMVSGLDVFAAAFDDRPVRKGMREGATADAIAGLEDGDLHTPTLQRPAARHSGQTAANNNDMHRNALSVRRSS